MTLARKDEARFLSAEERELVARSHQPEVTALADDELAKLRTLVRERRDRATDILRRQRREMRGKAPAKGAAPATADAGSKLKVSLLAQAMKRLNSETARRRRDAARMRLVDSMRQALASKQAAAKPPRPASRTARKGMKNVPSQKPEQISDPREIGRVSEFMKRAQARRDA